MKGKEPYQKNFTITDIQNYLEGKLSPAEMHAIEEAALNDPFLADAIEGIDSTFHNDAASFNKDVEKLRTNLQKKLNSKNKRWAYLPGPLLWKAAAVLVLVSGAIALTYNYTVSDNKSKVLAVTQPEKVKDSFSETPVQSSTDTNDAAAKNIREEPPIKKKKETLKREEEALRPAARADRADNNIILEESIEDTIAVQDNLVAASPARTPEKALQGRVAGVQTSKKQRGSNNTLRGIVKDNSGNPVVAAAVSIRNTKNTALTDTNGMFELTNKSHDSIIMVDINSVGYEPGTVVLRSSSTEMSEFILKESESSLSDVVVTGYGKRKNQETNISTIDFSKKRRPRNAAPDKGWKHYLDYLRSSTKTDSSSIKGTTIIVFLINENGTLSEFEIEKSLTPMQDAEAIRLVKEGPAWKTIKKKKEKIRLVIDF